MREKKNRSGGGRQKSDADEEMGVREEEGVSGEREDDVMLLVLKQQGPSGIALRLTDVQHLSGIKHNQQVDFQLRAAGGA